MRSLDERKCVPVCLRGGDTNRFLSSCEIETRNGEVEPIEYEGRRYVFSHSVVSVGYASAAEKELHVFELAT